MSTPTSIRKRRFWVISPNVTANEGTIDLWKKAIRQRHVAFMGYAPNDPKHKLGSKFANEISKGDVILIARRKNGIPDVVGFGIVSKDKSVRELRGFDAPDERWRNGSIRQLSRFIDDPTVPDSVPIRSVLNHTQSLCRLHPSWRSRPDHLRVCDWLSKKLGLSTRGIGRKSKAAMPMTPRPTVKRKRHVDPAQFDFSQRSAKAVRIAKAREAALMSGYKKCLWDSGRVVERLLFGRLVCDAHEEDRNNLIEAKSSNGRSYIRMAVGQLLDYAFLGKEKFGTPHMAILVPKKPEAEILTWLHGLKVSVIWKQRKAFIDNARGQFT
jgi:hypothetical protein